MENLDVGNEGDTRSTGSSSDGTSTASTPKSRRRCSSSGRRHSAAREQVLLAVEAQHTPVSIPALSRATGLHENTVREHLENLRADGYVTRSRGEAQGRGRPAWLWRATEYCSVTPYAALTAVLAQTIVATSDDPEAAARTAGRAWGKEVRSDLLERSARSDPAAEKQDPPAETEPPHTEEQGRDLVVRVLAEQGFAPVDTGEEIVLNSCPLLESAARHPDVVCSVHAGLVDALLAGNADGHEAGASADMPRRADLTPFAAPGQCHLRLRA